MKEFVEGHRVEAQRCQKEYYDKGSKVCESSKFTVGKPVLLSIPRLSVNYKLKDRCEGGWTVIVVMGPVNVKIQHSDGRTRVVHVNRLQHHVKHPSVKSNFVENDIDSARHQIRNDKSILDLNSTRNVATEVARIFAEIEEISSEQQGEESSTLLDWNIHLMNHLIIRHRVY